MSRRYDKEGSKRRILSVCVKLFIEKGFKKTTNAEILELADVTSSTFYNIFKTKDGVLLELTEFMFENQFSISEKLVGEGASPVMVYAAETALQLTLTELNENLREIYVEAYSQPHIAEYIYQNTTNQLYKIFNSYMPNCSLSDFYELEIGSAGIMRGYMSRPCDKYFTIEKKLERFIRMSLSAYNVPKEEQDKAVAYVLESDIISTANAVMKILFEALSMKFDFTLSQKI
ncbi:MAG TPA: TetR/AcrR family transcriptional regulator [Ruminococcaceae bacterium]|jgi:AcrR family transcriptional regulator|nr:TetR/AcrR family transcriptional regulator [Oscillospiraceae bacterium]